MHLDWIPQYKATPNGPQPSVQSTAPISLESSAAAITDHERVPVSRKAFDFLPDLMEKTEDNFKMRDDLKPLHVLQPEGVSFTINGNEIEWQKWKMHVAFSHREGIVISTVTYNDAGLVRPVFYRMSLAEMVSFLFFRACILWSHLFKVVPYGAPEWPSSRKFAFDTGEYGMGTMANELELGMTRSLAFV